MKDAITWFDIPTENFNRAVKFYSDILGREIRVDTVIRHGFFPMDGIEGVNGNPVLPGPGTGVGGNLVPPGPGYKPCANGTRVYLSCQGIIDEVLAKVEKAGGKIVAGKLKIGDMGWLALIMDTEGNTVGLHSFK